MQIPRRLLPPIQELHAFEAAARLESVSKAAKELDLTQSAVSRQIRALEQQLGVELFIREKQSIKLTLAGQSYAQDIREALRRVSSASLAIRANPLGGTLNLGILPTFGARWLAPRLTDFMARYPSININLFSRPVPFDFDLDSLDAAIHFGRPEWPETGHTKLFGETICPVGSPALLKQFTFNRAEDIRKARLLILHSRPDAWERWLEANGAPFQDIHGMMFDQFEAIIQAAKAGLGLGLIPQFLIKSELDSGLLVPAIKKGIRSQSSYYLIYPNQRAKYAPLVAFREWLKLETPKG